MNFLLDENFPKSAIPFLREHGHQIFDYRGTDNQGVDDFRLFDLAQHHAAILLTTDRDFYHTVPLLYPTHCGVVVIALRQPNRKNIIDRLSWLLAQEEIFPLDNKVIQLRDSTFRIQRS